MPALRRATRWYIAFLTALASAAVVAAAFGVRAEPDLLQPVLVLAPLFILAAALNSPLLAQVKLSANVPILIAAYLIGGWEVACLVGASTIVLKQGEPWSRRLFNTSQWVLMGLAGALVYEALDGTAADALYHQGFAAWQLIPIACSILTVIIVNAAMMLGVLRCQEQIKVASVWRSMVLTSAVPYFAYGLFGLLMAVLWSIGDGFAAALVLIPLLVARWAFAQYAEQRQAYEATIRSLVQAVETKDHYTRGHSERVSRASVMIARVLGMREDRVEALRYAGILHDVGKLGVPTRVLQKSGPLSDLEYAAIQLHPVRGTEMVRGIAFLEEAYAGILHHHERLDGRGYPSGLQGKEIPEFARVIAVADAFDSMTSTRSYRGARGVPEALVELRHCESTQFDPRMVRALVTALQAEPWRTVGPIDQGDADVELSGGSYDHDDPTVERPSGHDEAVAIQAARAEAAEERQLHGKDVLQRGGWS
ncbi:MAG TPA: HD-GYP domain-containing protein [Actinomycetes bacterium]|nr:HD-GYP domain-containing protein [Actinomycetes bacterium]